MELSRRITAIPPSPTVALNGKAKAKAARGETVYNFSVGEPDFPTPSQIVDVAVKSLREGRTKYGPAGGSAPLRAAICKKLKNENGLDYEPDQVVVGTGAKEILFHLALAILNEGDEVLLPAPYWVSYAAQIRAAGAVPVVIPMPTDGSMLSLEGIKAHESSKTKAIIVTSPNNPGGYVLAKEELETVGKYLAGRDYFVISDEIYEHLSFSRPHHSMLELVPELYPRFVVVNGLSKGYAMTGWRVGYMAGPPEVAKLVKTLQSHSSTCIPVFIDDAACFALEHGRELMEKPIASLQNRMQIAVELLEAIPEVSFVKPQGAFYIYIDIRRPLAASSKIQSSLIFSEYLIDEKNVAMVPGEAFGTPGFVRLSYATPEASLREGIALFREALREL